MISEMFEISGISERFKVLEIHKILTTLSILTILTLLTILKPTIIAILTKLAYTYNTFP